MGQVPWIIPNGNGATVFGTGVGGGRNTLYGPHFNRADFALAKNIKISERLGVQLRTDVRNAFNMPFKGVPDLFVDDGAPTFLNGTASAGLNATTFPRQITIGGRFTF